MSQSIAVLASGLTKRAATVLEVYAFSDSFFGSSWIPAKWRCLVPPTV